MVGDEVVGEVLVVEEGGKDVTAEGTLSSVLELGENVGDLVVVLCIGLVAEEDRGVDIITVGVKEIKVPKVVTTAFGEVLPLGRDSVLGSPEEVSVVSKVEVDMRVLRVDQPVLVVGTWDVDKIGPEFGDGL